MNKTVTSRFVLKGDNQSARAFTNAKKQLDDLGSKVRLYGALALAAGVVIVRTQADQIDKLAKTARAFDITTESLQAMRYQSELAGISADDFDKKLGKLQKNLGEIARRGGTMAEALADAGVNIQDVINLPLDKQLEAIARGLARMENQTIRASIAGDLFGRDAGKMLNVTDALAKEGLAGVTAEIEALGFAISRSEAAGVERMNDSMLTASLVGKGLAQQFTIALAPAIAAIAEEFTEAAKESGGFEAEVQTAVDGVVKGLGFVLDVTDSVGRAFKIAANLGIVGFESLIGTVWAVGDAILNGPTKAVNLLLRNLNLLPGASMVRVDYQFPEVADLQGKLDRSGAIIAEAQAEIDRLLLEPLPSAAIMERVARVRAELATAATAAAAEASQPGGAVTIISPEEEKRLEQIKAGLAGLMDQVKSFGLDDDDRALLKLIDLGASEADLAQAQHLVDELKLLKAEDEARKEAIAEKLAMEEEALRLVEATRTEVEQHAALVQRIGVLYSAGAIPSLEQYEEILVRVNEEFVESTRKVSELDEFGKQAARNLQTHFADFLFEPFEEGVRGMLKGFSETIRRMAAEATAASLFKKLFGEEGGEGGWLQAIFKGFGGGGGGGGGSAGGGGWGGIISSIAGIFGGKAVGGPMLPGVPYIVGERGRELVVPDRQSRVVPNHAMNRSGPAATYITNINMPKESSRRTVEQQGYQLARELELRMRRNG